MELKWWQISLRLERSLVDRWIGQSFDRDQFRTKIKQKRRKGKGCFVPDKSRFRAREVPAGFGVNLVAAVLPE